MKKRWMVRVFLVTGLLAGALFFLPAGLRWAANRVWPAYRSISGLPVSGGQVAAVSAERLQAGGFVLEVAPGVQIRMEELELRYSLPGLLNQRLESVSGRLSGGGMLQLAGRFSVEPVERLPGGLKARLSARFSPVQIGPLQTGPFQINGESRGSRACLSAGIPLFDERLTASLQAGLQQGASGCVWQASIRLPFSAADDETPALDALHPALAGVRARGELRMEASGRGAQGSIAVFAAFSRIELPDRNIQVDQLTTRCSLDVSGSFRSLPEQHLSVQRVVAGGMLLENLRADYQLEPAGVLFLESLSADWCSGRISFFNTRCGVNRREVAVNVFCDRLSLEQLLTAFGLEGVSVGGELNGRLPVRLTGASVEIDQGFLFTTPGRGGTLSFDAPETVGNLLPAQSLQAGQIGMISAALKQFDYDWITLTLNSVDDTLLVSMELSGRPAQDIPYVYDERRQAYVRVSGDGQGTRRPMRFTINLSVPFNQLLWYASRAERKWKQMQ